MERMKKKKKSIVETKCIQQNKNSILSRVFAVCHFFDPRVEPGVFAGVRDTVLLEEVTEAPLTERESRA